MLYLVIIAGISQVVDYMGGGELFFYLRKYIRFNETVVQFYAAEVLLALQYMHENNIIYRYSSINNHRDLEPANVLLDS
jgi:serine/threonine protein kinase